MKKNFFLIGLTIAIIVTSYFLAKSQQGGFCHLNLKINKQAVERVAPEKENKSIKDVFALLKVRKDNEARVLTEEILFANPDNIEALWAKAELLRRSYNLREAEKVINKILEKKLDYLPALNNLAYIRYKEGKLEGAKKICDKVLGSKNLDRENEAFAYLTLGAINGQRTQDGWLFAKIRYGTQIKCLFLKACSLAPDLAETHLALGTFYLKAPAIAGGDLDQAIKELELSLAIAPDFGLANARLAQAYKKKGELAKYDFYIERAKKLDPQNEALSEK